MQQSKQNELLCNLCKLHTTELGVIRIKENLSIEVEDVVQWCKDKINLPDAIVTKNGKNWYIDIENITITVNSYSYTIITAHKQKNKNHI